MSFQGSCLTLVAVLITAHAWYVPGVNPQSYPYQAPLMIMANSMTSSKGLFPFRHNSIKTCEVPESTRRKYAKKENLGEILWGDKIEPSMYRAMMRVNTFCAKVCNALPLTEAERKKIERRIEAEYRGNLILDNMPVAMEKQGPDQTLLAIGYPLGVPAKYTRDKSSALVNNYLNLTIAYHLPEYASAAERPAWRIVGFYVSPRSIDTTGVENPCSLVSDPNAPPMKIKGAKSITWMYSVNFREDKNTEWATRWDTILRSTSIEDKMHWFNIVNSSFIVLFLAILLATMLIRFLRRDLARYNEAMDYQEVTGWKLCHGDVFRTPSRPGLLIILVGAGCQLLGMLVITLLFALLGFLSPANRGALLTVMLSLYVLLGSVAGYVSAKLSKSLNVQSWVHVLGVSGAPAVMFLAYFVLNLFHWANSASSAVPMTSLLTLFAMWLCVTVPLVIAGGVAGFKSNPLSFPCVTNAVERSIPPRNWYLRTRYVIPLAGIPPFGSVFIELMFIMSSLWKGRVYYVFGFLTLVFFIAVVVCAEVAIVVVYFQLSFEDYKWWWRSFLCPAFAGVYLMVCSIDYYWRTLNITLFSSTVLYFGYMLMISSIFAVSAGTVGFLASLLFVKTIYTTVKVD